MPIPVICGCSAKLKVGDHLQGKHVKCPKCGTLLVVGGGAAPAPSPKAAPPPPTSEKVLADSRLSAEERDQLARQLKADERLVWADKPAPGGAFLRGCVVTLFLTLTAGMIAVAIAVAYFAVEDVQKNGMAVLAVPVLLAAGLLVAGIVLPFVFRWRAGRTFYAFTNKRALAWESDWLGKPKLHVYPPAIVSGVHQMIPGAAVGDLVFAHERVTRKTRDGTEMTGAIRRHGFFSIRQPDQVERLLREHLIDPYVDEMNQ
jgi:hypothetical protein